MWRGRGRIWGELVAQSAAQRLQPGMTWSGKRGRYFSLPSGEGRGGVGRDSGLHAGSVTGSVSELARPFALRANTPPLIPPLRLRDSHIRKALSDASCGDDRCRAESHLLLRSRLRASRRPPRRGRSSSPSTRLRRGGPGWGVVQNRARRRSKCATGLRTSKFLSHPISMNASHPALPAAGGGREKRCIGPRGCDREPPFPAQTIDSGKMCECRSLRGGKSRSRARD
jgi:hypothetical protein